jgi:AbiV family abortive infection protein
VLPYDISYNSSEKPDPAMTAKRLPNEQEATRGTVIAAANAAQLLHSADLLAAAAHYGTAVALAVLAFEESVKARTLGAIVGAARQGRLVGFNDDDLRKIIYYSHESRHFAGFFQHLAAAYPNVYGKIMLGIAIDPADAPTVLKLSLLAATANAGKQSGFYTDFDPDSGSWSSPAQIGSEEFDEIRELIGQYLDETQRQVESI